MPTPAKSVFGNFTTRGWNEPEQVQEMDERKSKQESEAPLEAGQAVELALMRSFAYRYLAKAFEDPDEQGWSWLTAEETISALALPSTHSETRRFAAELAGTFSQTCFDDFATAYVAAFGHAARGSCPMNEIEYGDPNADPLFQPHRLADLAAFYRVFGLEIAENAAERHDHLCIELEFMSVLAAKEAYAIVHTESSGGLAPARDAQRKFLRQHLGRWVMAFAGRLAVEAENKVLAALARLLRTFVEEECQYLRIKPGVDVLQLRPVDAAAESLCASCGLQPLPPAP